VDALIGMHGEGDIPAMAYGEVLHKRTRHSWSDGVHEYAVGFGTDWDQDGTYNTPFTAVTCVAPAGAVPGNCSSWTMTGTQASLTRAKILGKGKFGPTEFIGYYDLPFEARFSR
jgi:hypothetical protein